MGIALLVDVFVASNAVESTVESFIFLDASISNPLLIIFLLKEAYEHIFVFASTFAWLKNPLSLIIWGCLL